MGAWDKRFALILYFVSDPTSFPSLLGKEQRAKSKEQKATTSSILSRLRIIRDNMWEG